MNKNKSQAISRKEFIKLSIDDPQKASEILIEKAERLASSDRSHKVVKVLSEILFLNHCTIYRDCSR